MKNIIKLAISLMFISCSSAVKNKKVNQSREVASVNFIDAEVTPFDRATLSTMPFGDKRPKSVSEISNNLLSCLSTIEFNYRVAANTEIYARGAITINNDLVSDLKEILQEFLDEPSFSMSLVSPISQFSWDDESSMRANNTSGFNYRYIGQSKKLSNHSKGRAIDINPRVNPWVNKTKTSMQPANASVSLIEPGSLLPGAPAHHLVKSFKSRGWTWGGDWKNSKDYQHFEKVITYPGSKYCENPW